MSDNRPLDFQKKQVQEAEDSVYQGLKFEKVEEAQAFLDKILASKWWNQRVPLIKKVKVDSHEKTSMEIMRHGFIVYIKVVAWGMREMVLISALAKMNVSKDHAWNGKEYCKFVLQMVKRFMGTVPYEDLKLAFKTHGVRFSVRKKKQKV